MKTNAIRNTVRKNPFCVKPFWSCFHATYGYKSLHFEYTSKLKTILTTL